MSLSRRLMLKSAVAGFGYLAFAGLATELAAAEKSYQNPLAPKTPHFPAKAKRVIFCSMRGGPSHVDTFDYKPQLEKDHGKVIGRDVKLDGVQRGGGRPLLKSPWKFPRHGQSGLPISELFPELAQHADELCLLNGLHTDVPNHPQSFLMMHTGDFRFVRPSVGAWVLYGLGTENQNLPGFVTISPPERFGGAQNFGSAFLPAIYQGTSLGKTGTPIAQARIGNLTSDHLPPELKREQVDLIQELNRDLLAKQQVNPEIEGAIETLELGFRMQSALPEVLDLAKERRETLDLYGITSGGGGGGGKNGGGNGDFGRQCLMARRLAEAGVRFIEVCHEGWDQHNGLQANLTRNCTAVDRPLAALLTDLKRLGMLDDTLVVWGGEFGRTPMAQNTDGRDHNSSGFSMWAAGGGVKGGLRYGATDEYGIAAVENRMHIHDLHATMLHLLGLDHAKLTYRHAGRDYRLTDVHGVVAKEIIA